VLRSYACQAPIPGPYTPHTICGLSFLEIDAIGIMPIGPASTPAPLSSTNFLSPPVWQNRK
jgi:hypothetical protein